MLKQIGIIGEILFYPKLKSIGSEQWNEKQVPTVVQRSHYSAFTGQPSLFLGRVTVKVDPFPTALSTVMVPPRCLMISDTMYNPIPNPPISLCLGPAAR